MHNFDFSGMVMFWHIFDILQADREPTQADWERLFATPGYAVLTRSEFSRDFFIRRFRLAFKPGLAGELEQALADDRLGVLRHYLKVRDSRQRITAQQRLLAEGDYHQQVVDKCLAWLPLDEVDDYPQVAFVIFQRDARGYSPVVMDVLATIELGDFMPLFLAHEFHHWYRNRLLEVDWAKAPREYADLTWVLDQIHLEGLADQVDKTAMLAAGHPFIRGFEEDVATAPAYVEFMDEVLSSVARGERDVASAGSELRQRLPQAGHPVGYYIAREILCRQGKDPLVGTAGDPFAFYRYYGKLGPAAMQVLADVERLVVSGA